MSGRGSRGRGNGRGRGRGGHRDHTERKSKKDDVVRETCGFRRTVKPTDEHTVEIPRRR